ncbi:hypothetical protein [Actinoplanes sp. NPDC049802]|uniref:hypothetical protein n=1 Tax=Actinoplanes sp. NPDC049802 TaxID=3154742 RepID=UPI0033C4D3CC
MSLQDDRAELAAALSTVEGVTGHPYRPRVLTPGAGWPLLGRLERGPAYDCEATWRVVVILPSDEIRASEAFDAWHEPISDALTDVAHVDRIEPGLVATDAGDLEAMMITVRREA